MAKAKENAKPIITDENSNDEEDSDNDDDEIIGPLPPSQNKNNDDLDDDENDDDDDDDDNLERQIPDSHEVSMQHGTRAILALAGDPSGGRLVSGSIDYDMCFWDFAGMDTSMRSFRTIQPCENYPIRGIL